MPNIGPMEILLLGVLLVVLFGPAKLPEIARSIGKSTREFKDTISGTGVGDAISGVNDVRGAMTPTNLAKAAMPPSVKQVTADVTEMKQTLTDPLGQKKEAEGGEQAKPAEPASVPATAPAATAALAPVPADS